MSYLKHTPGDWVHGIHRTSKTTVKTVFSVVRDENNRGNTQMNIVCKMHSKDSVEAEADAKLIAAAPEMLEALLKIHDYWASGNFERNPEITKIAYLAIKKATE